MYVSNLANKYQINVRQRSLNGKDISDDQMSCYFCLMNNTLSYSS